MGSVLSPKKIPVRSTVWSGDVEKVHAVVAQSTFPSQKCWKTDGLGFRCIFAWQAQGIVHLVKSEHKGKGFVAISKLMAGVGHLKRIWKDAFSLAGAVQETCSSEPLGGQGTDFLRGLAFWSIRSDLQFWEGDFVWQVQQFVWPGITFSWQAQYFRDMDWKNRKRIGTRPSAFHFWRMSRRIASLLMLSTSKIEEVSQNSFVFKLAEG